MLFRRSYFTLAATSLIVLACADAPTSPPLTTLSADPSVASVRNGNKHGATLTGEVDQTINGTHIVGTLQITKLTQSSTGQLLASGVLTGTANGVALTQAFTDIPATLSSGSSSSAAKSASSTTTASIVQAGAPVTAAASSLATCDILFLDLGPLSLDLLGLTVDLSEVVLDINAVAGNLLGNLLCAVVGLLDGPSILTAVSNILNQINAILGAL